LAALGIVLTRQTRSRVTDPDIPRESAHVDTAEPPRAVTDALAALRDGAPGAMDRLVPLVYEELARIARRQLRRESAGHTLSTTALVHEAYLRLVDQTRTAWADRAHFFAVAARCMRRVLVDHARRHRAMRRGGVRRQDVSLAALEATDAASLAAAERADLLVAMDDALDRLAALDARQARVVECRFFGGLTEAEVAEALGVTPRTVARDWVKARGWLHQELRGDVV
jgi:RNA polymerase sigma factor (TIGR02999 family)